MSDTIRRFVLVRVADGVELAENDVPIKAGTRFTRELFEKVTRPKLDPRPCADPLIADIAAYYDAAALIAHNPSPSDEDIDAALAGNICRCGTYQRVREAVRKAAAQRRAER